METQEINQPKSKGGSRPGAGRPPGKGRRAVRVRLEPVAFDASDVRPLGLRARDYTGLSLKAYVDVLKNPKAADGDKIRAATEILNRGWGKAAENVTITSLNSFAGLSDGDIAATLANIRAALAMGAGYSSATDVTADTTITDVVGEASGVPTSEASPLPAAEAAEGGGEPQ